MTRHLWYKRDGAAFIEGTMGLTLEEKGAYSLCLDLIYTNGGPIRDDARWLAGVCGVSIRKWNRIRAALVAGGKLFEQGGRLMNARAAAEIEQFVSNRPFSVRHRGENPAKSPENSSNTEDKARQNMATANESNGLRRGAVPSTGDKKRIEEKEQTLSSDPPGGGSDPHASRKSCPEDFEAFWKSYPTDKLMSKSRALERWQRLAPADRARAQAAMPAFRAHCARDPTYRPLHAERFLAQRRFDGLAEAPAPERNEAAATTAWNGRAAPLVAEIGAAKFLAWFGEAEFTPGPPAIITVKRTFQRNWIATNYEAPLRRAFGEFELRAA